METAVKIARRKLERLFSNNIESAEVVNLIHVSDTTPGIARRRNGDTFDYYQRKKKITDKEILRRIRSLLIPPAWENVWICPQDNGHLQATGTDAKGRKQYKYHPHWELVRNHTKFSHLHEFGKALPRLREQLNKDLSLKGLQSDKVLATIVSLMQCTSIRIGNNLYEKLYGSYGLTTFKDKHVKINGSDICFDFRGKKGVNHKISLKSRKLSRIVQQCKDIPGKELFQYYDEQGAHKTVDSGMVNDYIRNISGGNFTAKDFRTWAGSLHALRTFKGMETPTSVNDAKKKMVEMFDSVAKHLGNTRAVCKKYYVHPLIPEYFANNILGKYLHKIDDAACDDSIELNSAEQELMKILRSTNITLSKTS